MSLPHPTPQLLPMASFSTAQVEDRHRYEAWRSLMGSAHDVEADPVSFSGSIRSVNLDRMLLHVMDASPQAVHRSAQRIRRDGFEHFVLHLSASPSRAETTTGELTLKAGCVSVNDLTRPSRRAATPEQGSIILSLSRELVGEAVGHTNGLHGLVLDDEAGQLLAHHMRALAARADALPTSAAPGVARATAHLFAACVAERSGGQAPGEIEGVAVLRAKRFIWANLGSPALTPDRIANAAGVSRSTLFRLFQPFGGVSAFILRRRLDRIRDCLIDPLERRSLASIAYAHGFASLSHFSRAFREQFDCAPRDLRRGRLVPFKETESIGQSRQFADWVRALG